MASPLARRINIKNKGTSKAEQDEIMNASNETLAALQKKGVY